MRRRFYGESLTDKPLVIATWGLPSRWHVVTYVKERPLADFRAEKSKEVVLDKLKEEVTSSTSLALFEDWDKIILLSVTLVDDEPFEPSRAVEKVEKEVENKDEYMKKTFKEAKKLVVAGFGTFGMNKKFKKFDVPYSNVVSSIALKLYKELKERKTNLVVLDITHGMNYHPLTTERVLREILIPLHAMRLQKKVTYATGTSAPPLQRGERVTYYIMSVIKEGPNPRALSQMVSSLPGILALASGNKPIKLPGEVHDNLKREVRKLAYPSPLYWSYVFTKLSSDDVKRYFEIVEEKLNELEKMLDKYEASGETVKSEYLIFEDTVKALLALDTVKDVAKAYGKIEDDFYLTSLSELKELERYLKGVEKDLWGREEEVLTDKLKEIDFKKLLSEARRAIDVLEDRGLKRVKYEASGKLKEKLEKLSEEEFSKALDALRGMLERDLVPYSFLRGSDETSLMTSALWWVVTYVKGYTDDDVRNFVAHAGMEQTVTVIGEGGALGYYLPLLEKLEVELEKSLKGTKGN